MEKINIAKLLENCPSGMELDCTMFEGVEFDGIVDNKYTPIRCRIKNPDGGYNVYFFTKHGYWNDDCKAKCVIFPKGKTTWEGFYRPFKDGDIVTWKDRGALVAFIYKERKDVAIVKHHFALYTGSLGTETDGEISLVENEIVFATEEEKAKLFKSIRDNGYKWNPDNKTLEKLPKFKIGDTISNGKASITINYIDNEYYCEIGRDFATKLPIKNQDEWDLISEKFPNKFNINTLIPFESRVLVRNDESQYWIPAFWGCKRADGYTTTFGWCKYCIPFEGNEHLLETTNDCNEYFKTWK